MCCDPGYVLKTHPNEDHSQFLPELSVVVRPPLGAVVLGKSLTHIHIYIPILTRFSQRTVLQSIPNRMLR